MSRHANILDNEMELGDGVCGSCGASHHITSPHEYNYSEVLDQNLICEICAEPLVDPVDLPCCHTFCKLCIDTCMVTGNRSVLSRAFSSQTVTIYYNLFRHFKLCL